ncbi:MAG: amino acid permease, partial [Deltaproteobacteria bacterium]|nr:amino acid permease [Deltaproteobacteria bacterium]
RQPVGESFDALSPFFSGGTKGLIVAMGLTFIALQGFDLIAAIAGEVKNPGRVIPRAMFLSLGCALVIYLPLLVLLAAVGTESGESIAELARREGDTVFATAVSRYMGTTGYWLVIVAAILSTLSALHANVLAASRVALSMSADRTLPAVLSHLHAKRNTPVTAVYASSLAMVAILFMIPDVGTAGAAAGLIFLVSFALAHGTAYLARVRGRAIEGAYRTPLFPLIPVVGGTACAALAVYQAVAVPGAASVVLVWLGIGALLYLWLLKDSAETADASAEAFDPSLVALRGKRPLVLLPIANPAHARALIGVANAIAPTRYARVLLLSVVQVDDDDDKAPLKKLQSAQQVVQEALSASYAQREAPEALITTASDPWREIERVADEHGCQGLLLGLEAQAAGAIVLGGPVEALLNRVDCDVSVMTAPSEWSLDEATRILVPVGGRGEEHGLRARVLGSLCRIKDRQVTFATVVPKDAPDELVEARRRTIRTLAELNVERSPTIEVLRGDDPAAAIVEASRSHDLILVGLKSVGWRRKVLGEISLRIARDASCATIMLSSARSMAFADLYRPLRDAVSTSPSDDD